MRPNGDIEAPIAMGQDFFEICPMEGLATFKEYMQEFFCDELIDKALPLLGRELRALARSAICITKLAVHAASLGDADCQFERLFKLGDALGCSHVPNAND